MTKLEELTELLVNEINEFNKGIERLEQITNKINTTKVSMDITEYKSIIESHQKKMNEQINTQERFESRFERLLKTAKVYPNWAVIVFIIFLLFGIVSTTYTFLKKDDIKIINHKISKKKLDVFNIFYHIYPPFSPYKEFSFFQIKKNF